LQQVRHPIDHGDASEFRTGVLQDVVLVLQANVNTDQPSIVTNV
jgi:hypothetical protein